MLSHMQQICSRQLWKCLQKYEKSVKLKDLLILLDRVDNSVAKVICCRCVCMWEKVIYYLWLPLMNIYLTVHAGWTFHNVFKYHSLQKHQKLHCLFQGKCYKIGFYKILLLNPFNHEFYFWHEHSKTRGNIVEKGEIAIHCCFFFSHNVFNLII